MKFVGLSLFTKQQHETRRAVRLVTIVTFLLLSVGIGIAIFAERSLQSLYTDDLSLRTTMRRVLRMRAQLETADKECSIALEKTPPEAFLVRCRDALDSFFSQASGTGTREIFLETGSLTDLSLLDALEDHYASFEQAMLEGDRPRSNSALAIFSRHIEALVDGLDRGEASLWSRELAARMGALKTMRRSHEAVVSLAVILLFALVSYAYLYLQAQKERKALGVARHSLRSQTNLLDGALSGTEMAVVARGIAHEINNPLTVVLGNAMRLKTASLAGPVDSESAGSIADATLRQGERIGSVIADFARATASIEPTEHSTEIGAALDTLAHFIEDARARAGVSIVWEKPASPVHVPLAAHQVFPLLRALVSNSLAALESLASIAREGAFTQKIRVSVECVSGGWEGGMRGDGVSPDACEPSDASTQLGKGAEWVRVVVEDGGIGIAEENVARIFLPFFSTHPNRRGLGLTAASRIVESVGGLLWLDSTRFPTRFVVMLPRVPASTRGSA